MNYDGIGQENQEARFMDKETGSEVSSEINGSKSDQSSKQCSVGDDGAQLENVDDFADVTISKEEYESLRHEASQLIETKDQLLRAFAEMENLRKRMTKERDDATRFAVTSFAKEMLFVCDNLERALATTKDDNGNKKEIPESVQPLVDGLELTLQDLSSRFSRQKIEKISPSVGDRFDPNVHEAMFESPSDQVEKGGVIHVVECGYYLSERLLRPAKVGVSQGAVQAKNEDEETNQ